jgi:hypothetical protein
MAKGGWMLICASRFEDEEGDGGFEDDEELGEDGGQRFFLNPEGKELQ